MNPYEWLKETLINDYGWARESADDYIFPLLIALVILLAGLITPIITVLNMDRENDKAKQNPSVEKSDRAKSRRAQFKVRNIEKMPYTNKTDKRAKPNPELERFKKKYG